MILLFAAIVGGFTVHNTVRIIMQVFFPAPVSASAPCQAGLLDLVRGIRNARAAAAEEDRGERTALSRFRAALEPAWSEREALQRSCHGDAEALQALKEVDRLRYAEEHAVRSNAVDLARLRRRVGQIEARYSQPDPRASAHPGWTGRE
ncbi:MAG: hypothetical protein R3B13_22460 [Polyangiaceae bacterium]